MGDTDAQFTFSGYEEDLKTGIARFHYVLAVADTSYRFTETLSFPPLDDNKIEKIPKHVLRAIFEMLHLALGISYWKVYCPKKIVLTLITFTKEQAAFWDAFYTKGLGEFFYRNSIDFRDIVHFPFTTGHASGITPEHFSVADQSLILLGGGKDSLVTAELLKKQRQDFVLFSLNEWPVTDKIAKEIGKPLIVMKRTIDPKLFELNKQHGFLNGHIPITAIFSLTAMLTAILYGYRFVIASNERSASYGNVTYLGSEINHQWSKSYEFEAMLRSYLKTFVTADIEYFSLLRPLTELHIAKIFSSYKQYFGSFTSCNRNFRILEKGNTPRWCGECPKCAFVFLLLAAFLPKKEVLEIFHKNLLDSEQLIDTYKQLLGLDGFKPFECVGTPEESVWAFMKIFEKGEYANDFVMNDLAEAVKNSWKSLSISESSLFKPSTEHTIPEKFIHLLD